MEQMELTGLLCRHDAPSVAPADAIRQCKTYHEAVQLCWQLRKVRNMTKRMLAEHTGLNPSHVSQYLSDSDAKRMRELPGWGVSAFELACQNTAISQWHAMRAQLTVAEEVPALRMLLSGGLMRTSA